MHAETPTERVNVVDMTGKETFHHLENVDLQDCLHRNIVSEDAENLYGYWKSSRLVGALVAAVLLVNSIYLGVSLPTNVITVIIADIGLASNVLYNLPGLPTIQGRVELVFFCTHFGRYRPAIFPDRRTHAWRGWLDCLRYGPEC